MSLLVVILIVAVSSAVLTAALATGVRRCARTTRLMDVPNGRSSHSVTTPRGGGLAIASVFLAGLAIAGLLGSLPASLVLAVLPAGGVVAAVGFRDDHVGVPAQYRILVHLTAVAWVVAWLGIDLQLLLPAGLVVTGWSVVLLASLSMAWFVNLFNFMDGIDGIAASEAVFLASAGALITTMTGLPALALTFTLLGAATAGFLILNWPPAKIFMGDVGSEFLGLTFGALFYAASIAEPATLWAWVILTAAFVTDATVTLIRRILRGDVWYQAHRSHAYQWAAQRWGHRLVTITFIMINVFWLLPCALYALARPQHGMAAALLAYIPLLAVGLVYCARKPAITLSKRSIVR